MGGLGALGVALELAGAAEVDVSPAVLVIRIGGLPDVRFLAGQGLDGVIVKCPASKRKAFIAAAVISVWRTNGRAALTKTSLARLAPAWRPSPAATLHSWQRFSARLRTRRALAQLRAASARRSPVLPVYLRTHRLVAAPSRPASQPLGRYWTGPRTSYRVRPQAFLHKRGNSLCLDRGAHEIA